MRIPHLGYGTGPLTEKSDCINFVSNALDLGYRHIDTAQMYGNEAYIGEAIRQSDIPREDITVATKIHPKNLGYNDVLESTDQSLARLQIDRIDLLYVHWPVMKYDPEETLCAFADLQEEGLISGIGLSNFSPPLLAEAIETLPSGIAAHQVEMHPLHQQKHLHQMALSDGHDLVAYCPLARGHITSIAEIQAMAEKHNLTAAQISLLWLIDKKRVKPIPFSTSRQHLRENHATLEVDRSDLDFDPIDNISTELQIVDDRLDREFS